MATNYANTQRWLVPTVLTVTYSDIDDVWEIATTTCGYWAEAMTRKGDMFYVREREPQGADHDYAFRADRIADAIGRVVDGSAAVGESIRCDALRGDFDADVADVVIQVACFGEVVYG